MRCLIALALLVPPLTAGTAADLARAIRENTFDRDECYRVRDLTLAKEDLKIYLTDGHLIFSKPVAGRPIAAVFTADVEGGDGEVILLPPDRAERQSLAGYIGSPNLDEHFHSVLFLFTGDDYDKLKAQLPDNPANKKAPEIGALLEEQWTPVLRNLSSSFQTRLTLDLLGSPGYQPGLFAILVESVNLGNFDIVFDPANREQMLAGRISPRDNLLYFDTWTSFTARSYRLHPAPQPLRFTVSDYRIEATVESDLTLSAVTRVKIEPVVDGITVAPFDVAPEMEVSEVKVDGRPAEVLQRDTLRQNLTRGGNNLFLVLPPEPLRTGRHYEFEFHHSGKVIHSAGDRVFYVTARGAWYPMHGLQYANFDLLFHYPRDLDLVSAGDVVEDRTEGEWRITRRRTASTIRMAAFNLGNYEHARIERGGYVVDVCANRALEKALQPRPPSISMPSPEPVIRGRQFLTYEESPEYGFVPRFPLLRQQAQFLQNRSISVLLRATFGLDCCRLSPPVCAPGSSGFL